MAASSTQQSNPFIRHLASSNRTTRDRAISSLRTYLHRTEPFTPLELLKLWKGLFFCMWMSDKPRTQQQLARDLADLLDVIIRENVLGFLDAFWKTMAREWSGIDSLRMDKYLYLVRCYVSKGFEYMARRKWRDDAMEGYLELLEATPLNAKNQKLPNGLRYHVIDIYVEELDKADTTRNAPVETLLEPLRKLGKDAVTKTVRMRAAEALDDERLHDWQDTKTNGAQKDTEGVQVGKDKDAAGSEADGDPGDDEDFDGFDD